MKTIEGKINPEGEPHQTTRLDFSLVQTQDLFIDSLVFIWNKFQGTVF